MSFGCVSQTSPDQRGLEPPRRHRLARLPEEVKAVPGDQRCRPHRPEDDPKVDGGGVAPRLSAEFKPRSCTVTSPLCPPMPPAASGEHPGGIVVGEPAQKGRPPADEAAAPVLCTPVLRPALAATEPRASQHSCWLSAPALVVRDPPMVFASGLGGGEEVVFLKESECPSSIARTCFLTGWLCTVSPSHPMRRSPSSGL